MRPRRDMPLLLSVVFLAYCTIPVLHRRGVAASRLHDVTVDYRYGLTRRIHHDFTSRQSFDSISKIGQMACYRLQYRNSIVHPHSLQPYCYIPFASPTSEIWPRFLLVAYPSHICRNFAMQGLWALCIFFFRQVRLKPADETRPYCCAQPCLSIPFA